MVKFSNKAKAKPSKRQNLKTKYKITRKVKQHKKKLKKQAKKLEGKGIKLKRGPKQNPLPNLFPFKNQILQHFKSLQTQTQNIGTQQLAASEWGLIALENKPVYFPKNKDHLTKKHATNEEKVFEYGTLFVQILDARNIEMSRSKKLRQICQRKNKKILSVVNKVDTIDQKQLQRIRTEFEEKNELFTQFTYDHRRKNICIDQLKKDISKVIGTNGKVIIVGKSNTGKHTIVKHLLRSVKFSMDSYADIFEVPLFENVTLIDTPYKLQDETGYPLFHPPSTLVEESKISQEEKVLKMLFLNPSINLNRTELLMHYGIQDYNSLDDMLKKIGKANRIFGKGGMVDLNGVRQRMLSEWYVGKLNYMFD